MHVALRCSPCLMGMVLVLGCDLEGAIEGGSGTADSWSDARMRALSVPLPWRVWGRPPCIVVSVKRQYF